MNLPGPPWFTTTPRSRRHLVAVSGGADSVALLHLLVRHGFRHLVVCHLNHHLRGKQSNADARFVRKLAQSLDLPCESGEAKVASLARRDGISLELAARHARHRFLAACARKHRCPRVLLAHHADDQAETVLLNLLRGSAGLVGMRESREHRIDGRRILFLRPLLGLRRADLRAWLAHHDLPFREDASNALPVTPRNRLRHEALPLIAEISGRDPVTGLVRAAAAAAEAKAALHSLLPLLHATDPQGRLHLPVLRSLPPPLQIALLHDFLSRHHIPDLSSRSLTAAQALLQPDSPPALPLPGGHTLRRRAGRIFLATSD